MVNENGILKTLNDQSVNSVHQKTKCNQPTIYFFQMNDPDHQKTSKKPMEQMFCKTDSPNDKISLPPTPKLFREKFLSGNGFMLCI